MDKWCDLFKKNLVHNCGCKAVLHGALAAVLVFIVVPSAHAGNVAESSRTTAAGTVAALTAVDKTAGSGLAQTTISREQAIAIARQLVGNLDGFAAPEVSQDRWHSHNDPLVWEIRWLKEKEPRDRVIVVVDAQNGRILEYDYWRRSDEQTSFPPKVSYEQAVQIAQERLAKLAAHLPGAYELVEEEGARRKVLRQPGDTYELSFSAVHDGVPFPYSTIHLSIDGDGNLIRLKVSPLSNVRFADKEGLLEEKEIRQKLAEQFSLELVYTPLESPMQQEGQDKRRAYVLSYVPTPSPHLIDAKTGQLIDFFGKPLTLSEAAEQPLGSKTDETQATRKPVTEAEALAILEQFSPLPEGVMVERIAKKARSHRTGDEVWTIQLRYSYRNGAVGWSGAEIAVESGKLYYFSLIPYYREKIEETYEEGKEVPDAYPVSWEKAKETALALVKQQAGDKLHELFWSEEANREEQAKPSPFYRFSFVRKVDGIRVLGEGIEVEVSAETGKIVMYHESWNDQAVFPPVGETADPQEVKQRFLDKALLTLQYHVLWEKEKEVYTDPVKAILVYELQEPWEGITYLDAVTGEVFNRETGKPAERIETGKEKNLSADIIGHPHEEALRHFLSIGVLEMEEGSVHPEKLVSRGEFLDMLLRTNYDVPSIRYLLMNEEQPKPSFRDVPTDHPYFAAVQWAVEEGLIAAQADTFAPDRPVTRGDAAQILVTALGYQKLAELDALFALPFADKAEIEQPGYAAIASSIGLISGTGQRFAPDAALTRAEVAAILYRFLSKQVEFRPQPKL